MFGTFGLGHGQQLLAEKKLKEEEEAARIIASKRKVKAEEGAVVEPATPWFFQISYWTSAEAPTLAEAEEKAWQEWITSDNYKSAQIDYDEEETAHQNAQGVDASKKVKGNEAEYGAAGDHGDSPPAEPEEESAVDAVVEDDYFLDHLKALVSPDKFMQAYGWDCLRDVVGALTPEQKVDLKANFEKAFTDQEYLDLMDGNPSDRIKGLAEELAKDGGEESEEGGGMTEDGKVAFGENPGNPSHDKPGNPGY